MTIRLVIADNHPLHLAGLRQMLAGDAEFAILGSCASGPEAMALVREQKPDVLLMDLHLKGGGGFTLLGQLRAEELPTRAVVLTQELDPDEAIEVMRLGAAGVVLKDMSPDLLKRCLRKVAAGGRWMETKSVATALEKVLLREAATQEMAKRVSQREVAVIRLVAKGLRNKEIAKALSIAEGTVKVHLHSIYAKLQLRGRAALATYASKKGLL